MRHEGNHGSPTLRLLDSGPPDALVALRSGSQRALARYRAVLPAPGPDRDHHRAGAIGHAVTAWSPALLGHHSARAGSRPGHTPRRPSWPTTTAELVSFEDPLVITERDHGQLGSPAPAGGNQPWVREDGAGLVHVVNAAGTDITNRRERSSTPGKAWSRRRFTRVTAGWRHCAEAHPVRGSNGGRERRHLLWARGGASPTG